ncbi:flavin reductase family protein [Nocardioides sp.]|uniref:flavin reductase family protein n=1 Tax=Nocardioides sp. TaxID=35761 RepID=UPI0039E42A8C
MSVEQDFRLAMRNVAAPVSVVTTLVGGEPLGTTVSAFDSLSMVPPMMTVALQDTSFLLSRLTVGAPLGINVLTADQEELAIRFAKRAEDRFVGVDWTLVDGAPRLPEVHSWIALRVNELVRGGDHVVVVGDVVGAARGLGRPLTYHDRVFGSHRPSS